MLEFRRIRRRRRSVDGALRVVVACALTLTPSCGEESRDPGNKDLVTIAIEPDAPQLDVPSAGGVSLSFTAIGIYRGGQRRPLDHVQWGLSDPALGQISAKGVFTAAGIGGDARITATVDARSTSTTLTLVLKEILSGSGVSAKDRQRLDGTPVVDGARAPGLLYPEADTMFPVNLPPIVFQWSRGAAGNKIYLLRLRNSHIDLKHYSSAPQWTPPPKLWSAITRTAMGETLMVDLVGSGRGSGGLYAGQTVGLHVARTPISGTIFYWATGASGKKNGIIQIDAGTTVARDYYTQANNGTGRCAGCHAVSRDGKKMLFVEYDSAFTNYIKGLEVETGQSFITPDVEIGDFFAFDRTGARFFSSQAGVLSLRSAATGAVQGTVPNPAGRKSSHPDWSPTEDRLVFARYPSKYGDDYHFCNGELAVMDIKGGGGPWNAKVIVPSSGPGDHNYYPTFSPDGDHIAFNKARSANNDKLGNEACDLYANPSASLYLVGKNGGKPQRLDRANGSFGDVTNSWPKWAPSPAGSPIWWLAFSSTRDYGHILVNSSRKDVKGAKKPQIWIAAIDMSRPADPSYPAFWLPGQETASGNHIPFWTRTLK